MVLLCRFSYYFILIAGFGVGLFLIWVLVVYRMWVFVVASALGSDFGCFSYEWVAVTLSLCVLVNSLVCFIVVITLAYL